MTTVHGLIPELPVADVDAALTFYRETLGFSVEGRHEDESGDAVLCGGANVYLARTDGPVCPARCWVFVDEVDRLCETLESRGAHVVEGVSDQPWGYRQFTVEDPDDHRLTFFRLRNSAGQGGSQ